MVNGLGRLFTLYTFMVPKHNQFCFQHVQKFNHLAVITFVLSQILFWRISAVLWVPCDVQLRPLIWTDALKYRQKYFTKLWARRSRGWRLSASNGMTRKVSISYIAAQCGCSEDTVYANCDADRETDYSCMKCCCSVSSVTVGGCCILCYSSDGACTNKVRLCHTSGSCSWLLTMNAQIVMCGRESSDRAGLSEHLVSPCKLSVQWCCLCHDVRI